MKRFFGILFSLTALLAGLLAAAQTGRERHILFQVRENHRKGRPALENTEHLRPRWDGKGLLRMGGFACNHTFLLDTARMLFGLAWRGK